MTKTLSAYKKALDTSQERYESMYEQRAENTKAFYGEFFHKLIKDYHQKLEDPAGRRQIKRLVEQFFATSEIRFAAIDGTSYKDTYGDYMVFFGASYAARGNISFVGDPPKVKYEKWAPEQDVSLVAYVPIPFAELSDVAETQFVIASDTERLDLSSIHTQLMLLAEIYLAYDLASASTLRPKLILWDQSMSGVLASTDIGVDKVDMVGYNHLGRNLARQDVIIAYSHPYNAALETPSKKKFRIYNFVLRKLSEKSPQKLSVLAEEVGISHDALLNRIKNYLLEPKDNRRSIVTYDQHSDELKLREEYIGSWSYVVNLFEYLCNRLYKEKNQSALIYKKEVDGELRERWLTPDDLRFLIAVGLRAVVEKCWQHGILLIGIAKDSTSKYLSRNYLGVLRHLGKYSFDDVLLPWTDRTFLELIPFLDDNLKSPWSTIEFDSLFMTAAYRKYEGEDVPRVRGVHGDVVTTERLFMRSLGQFYLNRSKTVPLTGHAIFIDRLVMPVWDKGYWGYVEIVENELGKIEPIVFLEKDVPNYGQDVSMYLLNVLTKNLYPEVIGYPDPLHKADWGAKSILKKVKFMIRASGTSLRTRPLTRTFRRIRDSIRRT